MSGVKCGTQQRDVVIKRFGVSRLLPLIDDANFLVATLTGAMDISEEEEVVFTVAFESPI